MQRPLAFATAVVALAGSASPAIASQSRRVHQQTAVSAVRSGTAYDARLRGTVTISAARAEATRAVVRIAAPVHFSGSCFPDKAVRVRGTAENVMLVLMRRTSAGSAPTEIAYFGRFPRAEGRRTFSSMCGGDQLLRRGGYDLVLLHTSGTARVTLQIGASSATRSSRPSGRAAPPSLR